MLSPRTTVCRLAIACYPKLIAVRRSSVTSTGRMAEYSSLPISTTRPGLNLRGGNFAPRNASWKASGSTPISKAISATVMLFVMRTPVLASIHLWTEARRKFGRRRPSHCFSHRDQLAFAVTDNLTASATMCMTVGPSASAEVGLVENVSTRQCTVERFRHKGLCGLRTGPCGGLGSCGLATSCRSRLRPLASRATS
jgi:hypothetical protein